MVQLVLLRTMHFCKDVLTHGQLRAILRVGMTLLLITSTRLSLSSGNLSKQLSVSLMITCELLHLVKQTLLEILFRVKISKVENHDIRLKQNKAITLDICRD